MSAIINSRVGTRLIDDQMIAFNCQNHMIAIWNSAAADVWTGLQSGKSNAAIATELAPQWDIPINEAIASVGELVAELLSDGFLIGNCSTTDLTATDDDQAGEQTLLAIEMMAIQSLIPYSVTFETTYNCNEFCIHCYMDRGKKSLCFGKIIEILDQLIEAGTLFISFTGGEFFTRKDALEIVDAAHERGFVIDILSNGIVIDKAVATFLGCRRVRRVQLSVYGYQRETHDGITRVKGSLARTIQAIHALKDADVKVELAYPMMRQNFQERYQIWEMAKSLDCAISPSPIITARNSGSTDTHGLRLTDEEFRQFYTDEELSALYSGRKPFSTHMLYFGFTDILEAAPCYSGFNTCAISPEGKVYPCNQLLYEVGNLTQNTFAEIWHGESLQKLRKCKVRDLPKCSVCPQLSACARCPGLALLEGRDLLGLSPENCRQTRIYSKTKGGEI